MNLISIIMLCILVGCSSVKLKEYTYKFKAGDCIRYTLDDDNEFIKEKPSYAYVDKVGKRVYLIKHKVYKDIVIVEEEDKLNIDLSYELVDCDLLLEGE